MFQDDKRKKIIARAIIAPAFRQQLFAEPEKVFAVKTLSEVDVAAGGRTRLIAEEGFR